MNGDRWLWILTMGAVLFVGAALGFVAAVLLHAIDPPYLIQQQHCTRVETTREATLWRCTTLDYE